VGNSSITQIGGQVSWSTLSDARLKTNIQNADLGLDFVLKLRPVTYDYLNDSSQIVYTGFLAQEVEETLKELNTSFSGITLPENETDYYSIRYGEFVVPLVNAVQEQNDIILELQEKNKALEERVIKLEKLEAELEQIKLLLMMGK
jgi:trimeric autotransporter adhesin